MWQVLGGTAQRPLRKDCRETQLDQLQDISRTFLSQHAHYYSFNGCATHTPSGPLITIRPHRGPCL